LTIECAIAEAISLAEVGLSHRVAKLLASLGLPTQLPENLDTTAVLASMQYDKKNRGGEIRFSLPAALGRMPPNDRWTTAVPLPVVRRAVEAR
jgi:3-dehydroquinate synthase